MESDKHYFFEGLFIIGLAVAAAFFFVWLNASGERDDVLYRIRFGESVSGLELDEPVKFRGVDVGTVKAMALDPADPRVVQVDIALRKDAPVRTDTRATLRLKGITGAVFVELSGGSPKAKSLLATTPVGKIPEIPAEKSSLTTVLDQLPAVIERFGAIERDTKKVLDDVGELTGKLKEDPSLLLRPPKEKGARPAASPSPPAGHP